MVKTAICSDIHGNYARLSLFKDRLEKEGVSAGDVYVLGDIVHYGAHNVENACIDLVKYSGFNVVRGNHDQIALDINTMLPPLDRGISQENLDYLVDLPNMIVRGNQIFIHSLDDIHIRTKEQLKGFFDYLKFNHPLSRLCFFGHSHSPLVCYRDSKKKQVIEKRKKFKISKEFKYLINPGSLGTETRGSYIVFNQDEQTIDRRELH